MWSLHPGRAWVPAGRALAALTAAALVASGIQAVAAVPAQAATLAATGGKGNAAAPVSNAFAMGGGAGGSIDQRTGAFQASVPLVNVTGPAGVGLSLALSYSQSLAAQGIDRFGFGAGWSLGMPWVDTHGTVRVYPASGGAYTYNSSLPTGLAQYPLRDLVFAKNPGTIPARAGLPNPQPYVYTLTDLNGGTTDRFDADGNLVEQVDRFGNPIDLTWRHAGQWWQPTSVADNYGQVTRFDYSTPGQVKVISPPNAEGITAATTLTISVGHLLLVTDPLNQTTSFSYAQVGALPAPLLNSVTSPAGQHTSISYSTLPYEPSVVAVTDVKVTNQAGDQVLATRHFNINPPGNNQHNYTGYPNHVAAGSDGLFTSGDFGYRYSTELSDGTSAVESTYNSLHLLTGQNVFTASSAGGLVLSQTQTYTYPKVTSVASLPPNYGQPTSVTTVYGDPASPPTRTETTTSSYDDRGLLESSTNAAGTTTSSTYNSYGLPATQTVTGKDGQTSITTNTFTDGGKEIATATTAVGSTAATATARAIATYSYNGFGQATGELLAWAPGAKPPGNSGGPDQVDDTQQISVDTAAHTQTDTVTTAAGTPDAASTTTVTDLVTGNVLSQTNPGHLTTKYTYDALGRELTQTAPGDQTTTTVYDSPTQTTVTDPNGLETRTTTDVLGRTIKVTDNVSGEKLVASPDARTLETDTYSADGSKLATTTPDGTTTTTFDPLGRPVSITQPTGITQSQSYDDVANTQTVKVLPAGSASPDSVTTEGFNNLNQPTRSATTYPDGTPAAPSAETYDGLGRAASFTAGNVTATPGYGGAGGLQTTTTLTPTDTAAFPGQPVTTSTGNTMTGALTAKTLTEQAGGRAKTAAAGAATGTTYTYNAAGQVATATDPAGKVTRYTYTPAGQIATTTTPSGTVTTYTYDPATGRLASKEIRAADGATQATGYTYYTDGPGTGLVKTVYDPADPADAISYDYDADGHVTAIHYPDGTSSKASYDDNGELATSTDVTGAVTTYTYNPNAGQAGGCGPAVTDLCQAVQTRDGTTLAGVAYTYDSLDRVHTITRGNGVTTTVDYNDASLVKTETTTAADGSLLRRDDYTYDVHGNIATHTVTSALLGHGRGAATSATTTTAYGYDAYNRLISSALYAGSDTTGTPTSVTSYTVDVAGDVTGQDTTTGTTTTKIVNTIDGGQLTGQDVNGTHADQTFDTDGNVIKDLAGNSYTYTPSGQIASVTTPAGVTTEYSYWPDGTRRAAATTAGGIDHAITYHYSTTGQLANDSYTGGGPEVTASYLMAVNREARTLATGGTAQTSGPGTGYYLTDAHTSVDAMVDDHGQITASYAYTDYGQPTGGSPALLPTPAPDPAGNAAVNPFTYDGAYTNPATGTQYLTARTYDPAQGRFLSLDAASQLNRYQAFNTNPILDTDPTGQDGIPQWLVDGVAAFFFLAFAIVSYGAAAAVLAGAVAGTEVGAGAIAAGVLNAVSATANLGAAATSATLAADDALALNGQGFLSDDQRQQLEAANFGLGVIAQATGALAGGLDTAATLGEAANAPPPPDAAPVPAAPPRPPPALPAFNDWRAPVNGVPPPQAEPLAILGPPPAPPPFPRDLAPLLDEFPAPGAAPPAAGAADLSSAPQLVVPPPADPPMAQFAEVIQNAGQDANLTPDTAPLAIVDSLPGAPAETNPGSVATTTTTTTTTQSADSGAPNPLAQVTVNGIDNALTSNAAAATPASPANPLGENLPAPVTLTPGGGLGYNPLQS